MRIYLLVILVHLSNIAFASPHIFEQRLRDAKNGDYIVTEFNQITTVFAIRSQSGRSLILEEISAPTAALKILPASWSEWVRLQAPGHTSWSMLEIDLEKKEVLEYYSFSRSSWVQVSLQDSILCTLLNLPLKPLPEREQKRIGLQPSTGEPDHRKIWYPPLAIGGRKIPLKFDVFQTSWPQDGSPLSGSFLTLYFDRGKEYPFPVWIQADTTHVSVSLRVIDAGHNLPAIHRSIPRRVPQFLGVSQKTDSGLRLCVKSPKYYRNFDLFAVDVTTKTKQIFPVNHILAEREGEQICIDIEQDELQNILKPSHRYTWLIVPAGHTESYSESSKSFVWQPSECKST